MSKNLLFQIPKIYSILIAILSLVAGCNTDERIVQLAREAADRQAAQNKEIARQNREIAHTTKSLVEAEGQSRKELVAMQHELQNQLADVAKQRDALEVERRQQAARRLIESMFVPILEWLGVAVVCALVLAYCLALVRGLQTEAKSPPERNELLVMDLASDKPKLAPLTTQAVSTEYLSGPTVEPDESGPVNPCGLK